MPDTEHQTSDAAKGEDVVVVVTHHCQSCGNRMQSVVNEVEDARKSTRDCHWSDESGEWMCEGCRNIRYRQY